MKKFVAFVLVLLMSLSLVACGGEVDSKDAVIDTLDDSTIEATTVDTSKEALIESFNYVSSRFDAVSAEINANIDAYDEEFIDGMIRIAGYMLDYKEILESDVELTEEEALELLGDLHLVDEWIGECQSEPQV